MPKTPPSALADCEQRYRTLARQLADIGYITSGSVALRYNQCGKAYCACHTDPARRHGPYWHFTAKVNGKTVNKRLTETEARLYEQWIANDRHARALLTQMRDVATEAAALILADQTPKPPDTPPPSPSPQTRRTVTRHPR